MVLYQLNFNKVTVTRNIIIQSNMRTMALVTSQILFIFWVKPVIGDWPLGNPPSQTEASTPASTIAPSANLGFPLIAIMAVWTSTSTIVLYLRLHSSSGFLSMGFVLYAMSICPRVSVPRAYIEQMKSLHNMNLEGIFLLFCNNHTYV